jgi:hypothetical protein
MNTMIQKPVPDTPAEAPHVLSWNNVTTVARVLWGSTEEGEDAGTTPPALPAPVQIPLLRKHCEGDGALATARKRLLAQTMVHGCLTAILVTMFMDRPVLVLVPIDVRLLATQRPIEIIPVPPHTWQRSAMLFQGTLLYGVRVGPKRLVLHDVAASCGYCFVGNARIAHFAARVGVLETLCSTLCAMLQPLKWHIETAPFVQCGTDVKLTLPADCRARGIWFVDRDTAIEGPRFVWLRHNHVSMALFGTEWFVSGGEGNITSQVPTVHVQVNKDKFPKWLGSVCPSSIGHFVPTVEHSAGGGQCKRWLLLHELREAPSFRSIDLHPWQRVELQCSSAAQVQALFATVSELMPWEAVQRLLAGLPLQARTRHTCTAWVPSPPATAAATP